MVFPGTVLLHLKAAIDTEEMEVALSHYMKVALPFDKMNWVLVCLIVSSFR